MRPFLLLAALVAALPVAAQPLDADTTLLDPEGHFAVYAAAGRTDLDALVDALDEADVVFLGEQHDDPVAHALQRRLLEAAHDAAGERPVVLSMEMFERDAQLVLDEYLAGLIRERDFLGASRPWGNYSRDYRPLVEYAKTHGLPVVAANAPGRYVSRVGREGEAGLDPLTPAAQAFLPPRPLPAPSEAYAAKFRRTMEGMSAHGAGMATLPDSARVLPPGHPPIGAIPSMNTVLAAQNLRDVTMAHAIAEALRENPGALVVHVGGSFHHEGGLGVPEHLRHYTPGARVVVVTMRPEADMHAAPPVSGDTFVILTDRSVPRSFTRGG